MSAVSAAESRAKVNRSPARRGAESASFRYFKGLPWRFGGPDSLDFGGIDPKIARTGQL
jgi:hypothetical protein